MEILKSVSKFVQRAIVGDETTRRAKQKKEPPVMRMIITEEPRPSHHDQVKAWINGGNAVPDRAARIQERIHELHHTDYMSFPQGEGTLGIHRVKGFKNNPHNVDQFYGEPILGSRIKRR